MQRDDVALGEHAGEVAALDVRGKVAVDDVGIAGDDAPEHVATDVRHPLADPAQADDAERHVADPAERSGRKVVPFRRVDVAMVGDDVAHEGERQRQGMRRDLADAVVGRIGDPDAMLRAGVGVHGVETGADPAHDADLRQRGDDALGDRRVLQQDAGAVARGGDHVSLGLALCGDELDAGRGEQVALEPEIGKIVVGEQDPGHGA